MRSEHRDVMVRKYAIYLYEGSLTPARHRPISHQGWGIASSQPRVSASHDLLRRPSPPRRSFCSSG